jgi:hypothetical protein
MPKVYLLDYVAGNVRSLVNAIEKVGYTVEWIRSPEDVAKADVSTPYQLDLNESRRHISGFSLILEAPI